MLPPASARWPARLDILTILIESEIRRELSEASMLSGGRRPRADRIQVLLRARMRAQGRSRQVCVRNISARGMLIQAPEAQPRGTYVEVAVGPHLVVARVVWSKGRRFGIFSQDPIDVEAIVHGRTSRSAGFHAAGGRSRERRAVPAGPAHRLMQSRHQSRLFQYAMLGLVCLAGALTAALLVRELLTQAFASVSAAF